MYHHIEGDFRPKPTDMDMAHVLVEQLEARIRGLEERVKVLTGQNRDLEVENTMLRDSIVEAARRLQEVVTWNEWDAPKRVDPDQEEA